MLVLFHPERQRVHAAREPPDHAGPIGASHAGAHVARVQASHHAQQPVGRPAEEAVDQHPDHDDAAEREHPEPGQLQHEQAVGGSEHGLTGQDDHHRRVPGPARLAEQGLHEEQRGCAVESDAFVHPGRALGQQPTEGLVDQLAAPALALGDAAEDHPVGVDQHHRGAPRQGRLQHGPYQLTQVEGDDNHGSHDAGAVHRGGRERDRGAAAAAVEAVPPERGTARLDRARDVARVRAAGQGRRGAGGAEHLAVGLHRHQVEIAGEALHHAGEEHVAWARVGREYFLPLGQAHQQLLGGVDQALLLTGDGVGHDRGVALGVTQGQLAGLEVDDDHPGGERAEADHPDDDDAPPDS